MIFDFQMSKQNGGRREGLFGPVFVKGVQSSWGNMQPTQELVDDYCMANGLPITDPASGYNKNNPYKIVRNASTRASCMMDLCGRGRDYYSCRSR